ncbi:DUF4394 domain-containing protein [uncultured Hymenobacter sp.]|uniref:DUF4394 domain-containing protein n=1 Tax=uncultured Hymenobacter sp. TaxID=170016 RepID=UPI0035C98CC7
MRTPLLAPAASGRGFLVDSLDFLELARAAGRRSSRLALLAGLGLGGLATPLAGRAQAPVVYGLGTATADVPTAGVLAGQQGLIFLDVATGAPISPTNTTFPFPTPFPGVFVDVPAPLPITGVAAGQTLVGMDYRPNTGQLFALGYNAATSEARLYVLNTTTGAATAVGAGPITLALGDATARIGFDFNPTVDRIRVVSSNRANFRLNPNNGALAATDGALIYNPGNAAATPQVAADPNAALTPGVGTVAYLNSYAGSTTTTLYDIDELNNGIFSIQDPPNTGVLNTQGAVRVDLNNDGVGENPLGVAKALDLDFYYNPATGLNEGFLLEVTQPGARGSSTNFYTFNLATRVATRRLDANGNNTIPAGIPFEIRDVAAQVAVTPTGGTAQGQLLYALAGGNLVSFDSQNPGVLLSAVNFGGGITAGQTVVGLDFRPATGELFALGYDAAPATTGNNAQLYTINVSTGTATAVGAALRLELGAAGAAVGFDFNPTVDRIRVTSASNQANYRLNPADGAAITDGTLTNPDNGTAPALAGVAYTNNDNDANTGTVLYGYDQAANALVRATLAADAPAGTNAANAGTYRNVGSGTGLTVSAAGVDFDIATNLGATPNTNAAFLVAAPTGTTADQLYTVDLAAGTVSSVGRIGLGGNLTAVAAFLTPGPVVPLLPTALTWNGSVSAAWNVAANWTPNRVPTATDDVVIPGTPANQPTVSTTQPARAVTLGAGAKLTLTSTSTLNVAGDFINNGGEIRNLITGLGAAAYGGLIALTGTTPQTIGGSAATNFFNLSIGPNGATLRAPAAVVRLLSLNGNLTTTGQGLTLLSLASEQGQVVNNPGIIIGAVTVQRAIEGSLNSQNIGYRHYAPPVSGTAVSDLNSASGSGFTAVLNQGYNTSATPRATQPFPNVFGYDQSLLEGSPATDARFTFDKGFFVPADGFAAGDARAGLQPGRGYSVNIADDVTVDFVGPLNNGTITVGGLGRSAADQAGYHLLGNPYPSALDWNTVSGSQIEPALYVFKSTGQYTGTYATYNNGVGINGGTNVLPVAQGFFVRAAAGASNGSVTFENADRLTTYDPTPFQRGSAEERPSLTLALRTAAGRGEQTAIYFEPGATAAYDARFDAQHLAGPGAPLSLASAGGLSINALPPLTGADVLVPLSLSATAPGRYTLAVDALQNLPAGYHAYLRDALTGQATGLTAQTRVPLSLDAAAPATGRYAVLFSTQAQVLATAPAALAQLAGVYPNPARGAASLLLPAALRGRQPTPVQVVNSLGQVVLRRTLAAGPNGLLELPLTGLAAGIYTVRAQTAVGQVVKRLTVE